MANLPVIKRFSVEDYPGETSWIGTLFYPLNLLLDTLYAALNNGITLQQNAMAQIKTVPVSGTTPVVSFPYQFSPSTPIGMLVINVVQTNSPAVALRSAVGCTWTLTSGLLTVGVQGLATGQSYNVTFYVIGG